VSLSNKKALHDDKLQGFAHFNELKGQSLSPEMTEKLRHGVFPSIFSGYSQKGIYCFRFHKNGFWRYVIIGFLKRSSNSF